MENPTGTLSVENFFKDEKVLIVDPSYSFGQVITSSLQMMGFKAENAFYSRRFEEAVQVLNSQKPRLIITEFNIEEQFGLSLVDIQSRYHTDNSRIAVMVTHNTSDSAVAEAAEEQIDAYLLKPFSPGIFRQKLHQLIQSKVSPNEYIKTIRTGKDFLLQNDFEKALEHFSLAKTLIEKPTLALFYKGQTNLITKQYELANIEFQEGLSYHPLHYKCLMGHFDALISEHKYADAYDLYPRIKAHYPFSAKRLSDMITAAVLSGHFQDILQFQDVYKKLDIVTSEINRVYSSALMTSGKYFCLYQNFTKAEESFLAGLKILGPDMNYLDTSIRELLKIKHRKGAADLLKLTPMNQIGQKIHKQWTFLVSAQFITLDDIVQKGRKLVSDGDADSECYRVIMKACIGLSKKLTAEDFAIKAITQYPELKNEFYQYVDQIP